jgi:hypothetical protein
MAKAFNENYREIWKHLADKYDAEGSSVDDILNEESLHTVLTRYFSHLSDEEKQSLTNELKAYEVKNKLA